MDIEKALKSPSLKSIVGGTICGLIVACCDDPPESDEEARRVARQLAELRVECGKLFDRIAGDYITGGIIENDND